MINIILNPQNKMNLIYIGTHLVMVICITFILSVSLNTRAFDEKEVKILMVRDKSFMGLKPFRAIVPCSCSYCCLLCQLGFWMQVS